MLINKNHLNLYETSSSTKMARLRPFLEAYLASDSEGYVPEKAVKVFLSHKHDDGIILEQVIEMLQKLGVKVYVDWMDEDMPEETSGETAVKIKDKIRKNDKFILLATENAIQSKWCNWELGFGDNEKYSKDIAIMPITENDGSWSGNEYLQIYPVIVTEYQHSTWTYYVEFEDRKKELKEWLNS